MVCGRLVISFKQASSEARLGTLRPATALLLCGSWPTRAGLARELAQTPKPLSHLDFSRCAAVYGVLDIGPFLPPKIPGQHRLTTVHRRANMALWHMPEGAPAAPFINPAWAKTCPSGAFSLRRAAHKPPTRTTPLMSETIATQPQETVRAGINETQFFSSLKHLTRPRHSVAARQGRPFGSCLRSAEWQRWI